MKQEREGEKVRIIMRVASKDGVTNNWKCSEGKNMHVPRR